MTKTALLLMDLQIGIIDRLVNGADLIERIQKVTLAARKAEMPIIYVVVKFRNNYPEISMHNKSFAMLKSGNFPLQESDSETGIHPALEPRPTDLIVTKRRVGAFTGSDLEIVLRSQDVRSIVLAGIATSGVILSTLTVAADMDYQVTVLSDCCLDRDEEVHRVLMEKVFPMKAEVLSAEKWLETYSAVKTV